MSGFRKAKGQQAALKLGLYGPAGSGKSFTALLVAEGLARASGKRIAFVDTERGTDFYCQAVPGRRIHPEAFDFDALYSRSITEILREIRGLSPDAYGVLVLDSISHVWESCMAAYNGKKTRAGTIPMHAWGAIKRPYKDLMAVLLSSPMHVLILGRQGNEYADDDLTGESRQVGVKMKAEGETPYEPHLLIRMEAVKQKGRKEPIVTAFAEKDRTGILAGRTIEWPTFETLVLPLLGLLGGVQAAVPTEEETAARDSEALAEQERAKAKRSHELLRSYAARFELATDTAAVEAVSREITPAMKREMLAADVTQLREAYLRARGRGDGELSYLPEARGDGAE